MNLYNDNVDVLHLLIPQRIAEDSTIFADRGRKGLDRLFYMLHSITFLSRMSRKHKDKHTDGSVPIWSQWWKHVVADKYTPYRDYLMDKGIIDYESSYTPGGKSMLYRLCEPYQSESAVRYECQDKALIRRHRAFQQQHMNCHLFWTDAPFTWIRTCIEETTIDEVAALIHVGSQQMTRRQREFHRYWIRTIHDGFGNLTINETNGRIQTPFTNGPKMLRKHLSLWGSDDLIELDIKNSQMYFLSRLMLDECFHDCDPILNSQGCDNRSNISNIRYKNKVDTTCRGFNPQGVYSSGHLTSTGDSDPNVIDIDNINIHIRNTREHKSSTTCRALNTNSVHYSRHFDMETFIHDAASGQVYERIADHTGLERDDAKTTTFAVLYSPTYYDAKHERTWAQVYPDTHAFCVDYKDTHGYNQLAIRLQKMESDWMLNVLTQMHNHRIPVISIYDSVLIRREDEEEATRILSDSFDSTITPSIGRTGLKKKTGTRTIRI